MSDPLITSLETAVAAAPHDVPLRVHLATLLQAAGRRDDAIRHAAAALERDPACGEALAIIRSDPAPADRQRPARAEPSTEFDWRDAEDQVSDVAPPRFVSGGEDGRVDDFDAERSAGNLADVMVRTVGTRACSFWLPLTTLGMSTQRCGGPAVSIAPCSSFPLTSRRREQIFRLYLRERPIAAIDTGKLAAGTDSYTGADIAHVCNTAAERAIIDSARTDELRMIEMGDLEAALAEVRPSSGPWFQTARNVALFANRDGSYDELAAYMKSRGL